MKIHTESPQVGAAQRAQPFMATSGQSASFSAALTAATTEASSTAPADFTQMTRKDVFDWMNEQIRAGKMSLDDSTPFLGMTMKISAASGQPVDMATDTAPVNFVEKARLGIEGARLNNDPELARRLQAAMDLMLGQQPVRATGA